MPKALNVACSLDMIHIGLIWFCVLLFPVIHLAVNPEDYKNIHVRGFQCNASDKYVYKNYSCYAKSFSRTYSTANGYGVAKVPLNNMIVSF